MRRLAALIVGVVFLAGCSGSGSDPEPAETVFVTVPAEAPEAEAEAEEQPVAEESAPPAAPAAEPAEVGVVPDVLGMNHQYAQDTMQAAGFFALSEEDATGQGRMLLYDRNWEVVEQHPAAGTEAAFDTTIVLRSKKIGE